MDTVFCEIKVNKSTLKVERQNAKAMIEGFYKNSNLYYSTIFTAHKRSISLKYDFKTYPKLIENFINSMPRKQYPLSQIGKDLKSERYEIRKKYIAHVDRIFHIKNSINIWKDLCNSGIFDIWMPEAPYNSLKSKKDPMILLLRVFEIDYDFVNDMNNISNYFSFVPQRQVQIIKPIIPSDKESLFRKDYQGKLCFHEITDIVRRTLVKYKCLRDEEVMDTIKTVPNN
jgi:hypothetical protein